jgi:uncharacterized RDD family membrane protein YckC
MTNSTGEAQVSATRQVNLATSARRLAAATIDWGLFAVSVYVFGAVVADSAGLNDETEVLAALVIIALAYYAGLTWLIGATPGKAILGIEVVRPDGGWVGLGRSVLRFVVWAILPVVSWAFVLSSHHRGIHDQIADTFVVTRP